MCRRGCGQSKSRTGTRRESATRPSQSSLLCLKLHFQNGSLVLGVLISSILLKDGRGSWQPQLLRVSPQTPPNTTTSTLWRVLLETGGCESPTQHGRGDKGFHTTVSQRPPSLFPFVQHEAVGFSAGSKGSQLLLLSYFK